jgi:lysozyme
MLTGVDVSHWQGGLDVAATGADFVIVKATDGVGWIDPEAVNFWRDARAAGQRTGLYHFYQGDPTREADFFVASVRPAVGESILVLDFETNTSDVAGAKTWLDRVRAATGVTPVIYMSQSVAAGHDWSSVASRYPLWVARYGTSSYGDTGAWPEPLLWQYTDAHHTAGYTVDGDYFYGSGTDWDRLAAGEGSSGGSEDDVPKYINKQNEIDYTVAADGEWHLLKIDDAEDSNYNLLTGPVRMTGVVSVTLEAPQDNTEINLRIIAADVKSGESTKIVSTWPTAEFRTRGGQTQIVFPFSNKVNKADGSGWHRRVRFQIKAWGGGNVKVLQSGARALYWEE